MDVWEYYMDKVRMTNVLVKLISINTNDLEDQELVGQIAAQSIIVPKSQAEMKISLGVQRKR